MFFETYKLVLEERVWKMKSKERSRKCRKTEMVPTKSLKKSAFEIIKRTKE